METALLSESAYRELEAAVGEEHACRDPAVLDGYAWQPTFNYNPDIWAIRPVAVLLPGSTEEVQEAVRACNRHGLRFKALSTGWSVTAAPWSENVVLLDMRRMNRILELDEKNMYAVVEPCAIGAQIQAEAMKRGLNIHMIAAGCGTSPLASATSFMGHGWDGIRMSYSPRNLLGVEWVLPTGEVLRLGSLGSAGGWFSGDGPGPSLRGIMRGALGAFGGCGVFTKCALKLYAWPGPPQIPAQGLLLDTRAEVPPNVKVYLCMLPSWEKMADAIYDIGDAEIGYILSKTALGLMSSVLLPRLTARLARAGAARELLRGLMHEFQVFLVAGSLEELKYQDHALLEILARHGGVRVDLCGLPFAGLFWWGFIRNFTPPITLRTSGNFYTLFGADESLDSQVSAAKLGERLKAGWLSRDLICDDLGDTALFNCFEDNTWAHCEVPYFFDPRERGQTEAIIPEIMESVMAMLQHHLGVGMLAVEPRVRKVASPMQGDYNLWQRRIQEMLDPAGAADSVLYTGEEDLDHPGISPEELERMRSIIKKYSA